MLGNIARGFMSFAKAIARSTIGRAVLQIAACAFGGPAGCAAASAGLTLAAGGTLKQALIGAAISFAQVVPGGIWDVVGDVVAATGTGMVGTVATHSVVGGAISMAQGGSFETGAISGAISAGAAGLSSGAGKLGQLVITAAAGGTASVLAGGKFANGAITGAFALMFNDWRHGDGADGAAGTYGSPGTQSGSTNRCDYEPFYCSGIAYPSYVLEEAAVSVGLLARGLLWVGRPL